MDRQRALGMDDVKILANLHLRRNPDLGHIEDQEFLQTVELACDPAQRRIANSYGPAAITIDRERYERGLESAIDRGAGNHYAGFQTSSCTYIITKKASEASHVQYLR